VSREAPRRSLVRRIERWGVGLAMAALAFVLEKGVVRQLKRRGTKAPATQGETIATSRGGEVDL
jgi:hypothetical protein